MKHEEININCLAFQLAQARKRAFSWYERHLRPLGLTPLKLYVLGVLQDLGDTNPSEIADRIDLERPTVTGLLNRMERDGFVVRKLNPANRREVIVSLTTKGREAAERAYPMLIEADRALDELLGGELESLKRQLRRLTTRMDAAE